MINFKWFLDIWKFSICTYVAFDKTHIIDYRYDIQYDLKTEGKKSNYMRVYKIKRRTYFKYVTKKRVKVLVYRGKMLNQKSERISTFNFPDFLLVLHRRQRLDHLWWLHWRMKKGTGSLYWQEVYILHWDNSNPIILFLLFITIMYKTEYKNKISCSRINKLEQQQLSSLLSKLY